MYALVALAPWVAAGTTPAAEFGLALGGVLLAGLWAAHAVVAGRFAFRADVVAVCLAGLVAWSAVQLVPLPEAVVGVACPARLELHRTLLPDRAEVLPGETAAEPRPTVLTLTTDAAATRTFLARVLGLLLVYAAARNWLATRASFPRFARVAAVNGTLLAVYAVARAYLAPADFAEWGRVGDWLGGGGFGPFPDRAAFPDTIALCLGLTVGATLSHRRGDDAEPGPAVRHGWTAAGVVRAGAARAAVAVMVVSLVVGISGGLVAVVAAAGVAWVLTRVHAESRGRAVLAAAVALGATTVVWLGTVVAERKFPIASSVDVVSRGEAVGAWRGAAGLIPQFWSTGTGNGTFAAAEATVRSTARGGPPLAHAGNEWLEALIEGGVVRLGLTVALPAGVLWVVGRGYLRRRSRSVGPWLIGAWFGLAAVTLHAAAGAVVHVPAVALFVAAAAGFAVAGATNAEFVPARIRVRKIRAEDTAVSIVITVPLGAEPLPPVAPPGWVARGWLATGVGAFVLIASGLVAVDARSRDRAERLRAEATRAGDEETALVAAVAAAAARPDDPAALAAAGDASARAGRVPAALAYYRAARAANPLAPRPHVRLGELTGSVVVGEPAVTHFARAERVAPADAAVWFAVGQAARARGDAAAAWAAWKHALAVSVEYARPILAVAGRELTPAEVRARLLPDDPVVLMAAADVLFPDRGARAADRAPFVAEAAALFAARRTLTADEFVTLAAVRDEQGQTDDAAEAWQRALALAPHRADVRDRYTRWLEQEERYGEAIVQLKWLKKWAPALPDLQDRLDAAHHGLQLADTIRK
ncbi:TPR repeat protein [Fimbriiglobus ruber]|uniref:TPR repeat protein n=1 Tax=Fimbriiglobus ruber TaxID=1908690 RepID=A0A225DUX3_9BACT|nr:TPR repeat protein [Fimbriiglobus ruber]